MDNNDRWANVCEVLGKVERTRSRTQKGYYLMACSAEEELKRLLQYALDFHNLYGITLEEHGQCTPYEPVFPQFVELLDTVLQHRTSPAALRDLYEKHPCKWFARVVNHDLRCGLGIKTVNSTFSSLIPEFSIQLCEPYDSRIELYDTSWIVEPKFDGIRGFAGKFRGNEWQCLSRNGKELFNTSLVVDFLKKLETVVPEIAQFVLDGEFVAEDWNRTITTLHTQSVVPNADKLKFQIFDQIFLPTFPYDNHELAHRKERLESLSDYCVPESPVQIVKSLPCGNSLDAAWRIASVLHNRGYEGAIVKALHSKYEAKRTDYWSKLKFYHTVDVEIIGSEEGTGRNKGRLGALCVRYGRYESKVGTGFDDQTRSDLWLSREGLVGMKCEITYQELTDNSFRFPVFIRLRPDK